MSLVRILKHDDNQRVDVVVGGDLVFIVGPMLQHNGNGGSQTLKIRPTKVERKMGGWSIVGPGRLDQGDECIFRGSFNPSNLTFPGCFFY